mmetsp:Transcript_26479/g.43348  ORF Transcript_26479/g.43348 Transcript_26479/m.43348 type:complete len:514 (-) Transcript_26479:133-1674(-)
MIEKGDEPHKPIPCPALRWNPHQLNYLTKQGGDNIFRARKSWADAFGGIYGLRASIRFFAFSRVTPVVETVCVTDHKVAKAVFADWEGMVKRNRNTVFAMEGSCTRVNGDCWRRQRDVLNQVFSAKRLEGLAPDMICLAQKCISDISTNFTSSTTHPIVNVVPYFQRYSIDCTIATVFGTLEPKIHDSIRTEFMSYWRLHRNLDRATESYNMTVPLRNLQSIYCDIVSERIMATASASRERTKSERKRDDKDNSCLLDGMIQYSFAAKEGEEKAESKMIMSCEEIVANLFSFFTAGFETAAHVMTMAIYSLAKNPKIQALVYKEISSSAASTPTLSPSPSSLLPLPFDHILQCRLLNKVVKETLRLYPPVMQCSRVSRFCTRLEMADDDKSGDAAKRLVCRNGTLLFIDMMGAHLSERVWGKSAMEFDPWRWDTPTPKQVQSYMPFGGGGRICVAYTYALAEVKIMLAVFLKAFTCELSSDRYRPEFHQAPTLVLRNDMPVRLYRRRLHDSNI